MKVLICVPAFGFQNSSETTKSLVALTAELTSRGIFAGFATHSFPDIVDLRNVFLTIFLDAITEATHLLFVDADMQFAPELVRDMLMADKPLIGALYPKKRLPISYVGSSLVPPAEPENGLLELQGIGCGVMLIRRDAVTTMIESGNVEVQDDLRGTALTDLLDPYGVKRIIKGFDKVVTEDGRHLSEDFSFCHRHRAAGGKVFAAIDHPVTHLGIMPFTGKYSDLYKDEGKAG